MISGSKLDVLASIVLGMCLVGIVHADGILTEREEPPLVYELQVGDQRVIIKEGESQKVNGQFTDPQITLAPRPTRLFQRTGIEFEYPRQFTFEADLDGEFSHSWTLSGNDLKVMYFEINGPLSARQLADNMMNTLGREACQIIEPKATLTIGETNLSGIRFHAQAAGHTMLMEIYGLPKGGGKNRLLMFQDSLGDEKQGTQEGRDGKKLFVKSCRFVP